MEAKTEKKGNIIDAFVGGARNGFKIGTNSMVPNIIFGFAVISILNLTGLMEIIGKVFTPIMGIFGLPGVAATAWMAIFVSMGGAAGGRMLGTAELDTKYYPHMFTIATVNGIIAMLIMNYFIV